MHHERDRFPDETRWRLPKPLTDLGLALLLVWFISPFALWLLLGGSVESRGQFGDSFGFINSLFSGLALAGIVYTILLQQRQFTLSHQESRRINSAEVFIRLNDKMIELRPKWLALFQFPEDPREWSDDQKATADEVGLGLEVAAYFATSNFIDQEYVMSAYATTFVKCWDKLEDFIKAYRVRFGEPAEIRDGAFQRRHFEEFAHQCAEYMKDPRNWGGPATQRETAR